MELAQALLQIKDIKPSQFGDTMLVAWISELDGQLHDALMTGRKDAPTLEAPYTVEEGDQVLLVPFPYDQIYIYWLAAKIDHANQEFDRYNNNMALFNSYHDAFCASYARAHASTDTGQILI